MADAAITNMSFDERLAVYRYFRSHWLNMLNGADQHAISAQVTALLSADIEFRTLDHARSLCASEKVGLNGMAHWFINQGFLCHQAFAIRRITEDYDGQRKKAVFSLPRIISEMEANAAILTRDVYVVADISGDRKDAWETVLRNESFDELAGVTSEGRKATDTIRPDFFKSLRKRIAQVDNIRTYANKILAHAADPSTRSGTEGFSLNELDAAYMHLIWVTNQLSSVALYGPGHVFLPSFVYDPLENICAPFCPPNRLSELHAFWEKRRDKLEEMERSVLAQETL
jgi:hypothetical protein